MLHTNIFSLFFVEAATSGSSDTSEDDLSAVPTDLSTDASGFSTTSLVSATSLDMSGVFVTSTLPVAATVAAGWTVGGAVAGSTTVVFEASRLERLLDEGLG